MLLAASPGAVAFPNAAAAAANRQLTPEAAVDAGSKWVLPTVRGPPAGPNEPLRLILTTECNFYQFWQAQVLLSSALDVGQPAPLLTSLLAVGCEKAHATHAEAASRGR